MRQRLSKFQNRFTVFLHDLAMIPVAWIGAYWLRFNLDAIPPLFWQQALAMLPVLIIVQGIMFWYFGLYRGVWRFASIPDLARILKAAVVGVVVSAMVIFLVNRLQGMPRSVFVLDADSARSAAWALHVLFIAGSRTGACIARK